MSSQGAVQLKRRRLLFSSLVLTFVSSIAIAQTTGSIGGFVYDSSGLPVAGAAIEVASPSLQGTRTATSGPDGFYRVTATPPGEYRVRASRTGFRSVEKTTTVRLGSVASADFTLEPAAAEQVVVVGGTPLIDRTSTSTGTNYTAGVIALLPVSRNYADIMRANPGVSNDINGNTDGRFVTLSVYGATAQENQWVIDGVTTTQVVHGAQGKAINSEFVQEVSVMTGGYSAEYGRALGGVVNAVTKSGGNEFHGDGFVYYDSKGTAEQKEFQPGDSGIASMRTVDGQQFDYGIDLGGPVLKDRLWFFGAYNRTSLQSELSRVEATTHVSTDERFPLDTASNYYLGKLTWNLAASTTVVGSVFADPSTKTGLTGDDPVNPDPSTWWSALSLGGTDYGVRLSQLFGSQVIAALQGSYHEDQSTLTPPNGIRYLDYTCAGGTPESPCNYPPEANDIYGGYGFVGGGRVSGSSRKQVALSAALSAGDHQVKAGGDYMDGQTENERFRTGGQQVYIYNEHGQLYYEHRFYTTDPNDPSPIPSANSQAQVLDYGAYVEDSWRPAANVTVNVGLRWDGEDTRNYAGQSVLLFSNWQPRVGVVWDPWRDGQSKVYAFAGRFSHALPTYAAVGLFGSWPYNMFTYNFDPNNVTPDPDVIGQPPSRIRGPSAGPFGTPVDANVKGSYQQELTAGIERLILPTLTVGIKGTYRSLSRAIEDRCDFDYNSPEISNQCVVINPGSNGKFASGDAPVCNYIYYNYPEFWQCSSTGPPSPDSKRYYRGFEVLVRDSIAPQLWLQASYVYSSLRGNYGAPDGVGFDFDYPPLWHNADGALPLDRPNRFRLDGFWVSPWQLAVGLQAFAETGAPLSKFGFFNGGGGIFLTPQGSEGRLPTLWGANLTLGYPIVLGPVTVNLQAYLYNLFNKQIVVSKDQNWSTYSPPDGFPANMYDPNQPQTNTDYGLVTGRANPRLFRAAVKVSF